MHVEFLRKKESFWFLCAYRIPRYNWGIIDWNTGIHLVKLGHSTDLRIHLPVRWADTFYVEVATGKYHFAGDLIKEYGRQTLCKLVAEGKFVNEGHWEKMQEGKK